MNSQGDIKISAMRAYLKGSWESVHQSMNSRNKSDISAGDKLLGTNPDGKVAEHA
jgi:hypothetical protein